MGRFIGRPVKRRPSFLPSLFLRRDVLTNLAASAVAIKPLVCICAFLCENVPTLSLPPPPPRYQCDPSGISNRTPVVGGGKESSILVNVCLSVLLIEGSDSRCRLHIFPPRPHADSPRNLVSALFCQPVRLASSSSSSSSSESVFVCVCVCLCVFVCVCVLNCAGREGGSEREREREKERETARNRESMFGVCVCLYVHLCGLERERENEREREKGECEIGSCATARRKGR